MPIKLYFEKIDNPHFAITTNGDDILYNLKQIGEDLFNDYTDRLNRDDEATLFKAAGRFMCIISLSYMPKESIMTVIDFANNIEEAQLLANDFKCDKDLFMDEFNKINYIDNYNDFEIIERSL